MDLFLTLKVVHVVGATVLLGTGVGIAFFMVMAHLTRDVAFIARTATVVVLADGLFTASAAILQPISGAWLAHLAGLPLLSGWVGASVVLYVIVGCLWLPVVVMQIRMRDLARAAWANGQALSPAYHRLFRMWVACGALAFPLVIAIVWLMIAKP